MLNLTSRAFLRAASSPHTSPLTIKNTLNYTSRSLVILKNHKYTAHAVAKGAGRNGEVESNGLALHLASPKELGGKGGEGQNPEQLFAMGYSGCLLGAIQMVAGRMGRKDRAKDAVVHVSVHIGEPEEIGGFGIGVDIKVEGVDDELLRAGHEACPYSRALKYGSVVNISKA